MTIDLIAFISFAVVVVLLIIDNLRIRAKRRKVATGLVQQTLDKMALLSKIEQLTTESNNRSVEQTDGFLKFVSDSRDWAFQYIEEVQDALEKFDKAIAPDLAYAQKYGMLSIDSPSKDAIERIAKAYTELKEVLPKDNF